MLEVTVKSSFSISGTPVAFCYEISSSIQVYEDCDEVHYLVVDGYVVAKVEVDPGFGETGLIWDTEV